MQLLLPVVPYHGTRGIDAFGGGGFNAPRSRNGKPSTHKGLDFITSPGDLILMPFSGFPLRPGRAYDDADLGSIHLEGVGEWAGYTAKLLYVEQLKTIAEGQGVLAGGPLGIAQNVSEYHESRCGDGRKMVNHCHFELRCGGELLDPTPLFMVA